jgi:tetratricopeptide (TPR) repeat protein
MKSNLARTIGPILALALVSGCQALGAGSQQQLASSLGDADMSSYFAQSLAEGRGHLVANRPAAALDAYRQASYDPASRAAAYNGMAIAADRLGRPDLAERYFLQAMSLEPDNTAFAANLLRLQNRHAPAEGDAALAAVEVEAQQPAPNAPADEASGLQRLSEREVAVVGSDTSRVSIATPTAGPARVRVETRRSARGLRGQQYPVRVAIGQPTAQTPAQPVAQAPAQANRPAAQSRARRLAQAGMIGPRAPTYPVRVQLGGAVRSQRSAAPEYPVRVQLDQS